jgi:hypothetical protein
MPKQACLGRYRVYGGSIGTDNRCAMQKTGAEYQQIIGGKCISFGGNSIPNDLGGGTLPAKMEFRQIRVGFHPFDVTSR